MCAQLVHAAGESSPGSLPPDTFAIALRATAEQLAALEARLLEAGITHVAIREPDHPYNGALVAIGIAPQPRDAVRQYVRHLQLIGDKR